MHFRIPPVSPQGEGLAASAVGVSKQKENIECCLNGIAFFTVRYDICGQKEKNRTFDMSEDIPGSPRYHPTPEEVGFPARKVCNQIIIIVEKKKTIQKSTEE